MTLQTTNDDRNADEQPTPVRLDDLRERAEALAEDDSTEFENRSEVIREGVRRLVTEHECKQRLHTDEGVSAPNLDAVVERAPNRHPLTTDGGEDA